MGTNENNLKQAGRNIWNMFDLGTVNMEHLKEHSDIRKLLSR